MALWGDIFEKFEGNGSECYSWWGKISKTEIDPVMEKEGIVILTKQIQAHRASGSGETHLYMYCADFPNRAPSLHVGHVIEVRPEDGVQRDDPHVPEFYRRIKFPVPFWFKLADIRIIQLKRLDDLVFYPQGKPFDANVSFLTPKLLIEKPPKHFFAHRVLERSGWSAWWKECLHGAVDNFPQIHHMISVPDGSTYFNYKNLFGDYLKLAKEIRISDPYIRKPYQARNVEDLLSLVKEPRKTQVELETMYDEGMEAASRRLLDDLKDVLVGKGFDFKWILNPLIDHDRFIETERWEIYLGRGLDFIFQGRTKRCNIFFVQK